MARYIREVKIDKPSDFVEYMMNDFLMKHGFKLVEFKGQRVYRAGGGFIEIPKFLIWGYQNGIFHIEAWSRTLWLPGVYGRENAMTGFMGAVPKGIYKQDVEQLLGLMAQPLPSDGQRNAQAAGEPSVSQGAMPQNGQPVPQTIYVQGVDTSRYATFALVMGIVGILTSWLWVGIIFSVAGIIYGRRGQNSSKKGMASAGFVCGIIGTVLFGLILLLSFIGGFANALLG